MWNKVWVINVKHMNATCKTATLFSLKPEFKSYLYWSLILLTLEFWFIIWFQSNSVYIKDWELFQHKFLKCILLSTPLRHSIYLWRYYKVAYSCYITALAYRLNLLDKYRKSVSRISSTLNRTQTNYVCNINSSYVYSRTQREIVRGQCD